ncbi:MAG: NAD-dependent epimerase/dehydratase family protein [Phycisphaerae bacterium]|jgi:UDP-glucose 4-epimerase|nr:NAD-dependent epimerase/dehydratase family protein [Phycisphaerae bacterium]
MESMTYDNYFKDRTVLVTGGAGFIGSHLTQHLTSLGAYVRVLDDLSTGHRTNLCPIDATLIEGSILDNDILEETSQGCSLVFHEAAFVSVPESFEDKDRCRTINVEGTSNVLRAAQKAGCERVVFASTAACYGSHPTLPSSETDQISAESPYAQSKVMGEQLMKDATVDAVSLRYFNAFGARQDPKSAYSAVVTSFADAIKKRRPIVIYGDGEQTRDFVPVENIVHANLLAAAYPEPLRGEVFNVGTGNGISLLELIQLISGKTDVEVLYKEQRTGDVRDSRANITNISTKLGYSTIIETGIALGTMVNH